ncbi:TPA: ead/Ea22-like family protein [Escherichia coli]|nr:ead/Ea22-like family protein [Escherichia coli]EEV5814999.1 ead/Ea22-like family protein [Escherichia coli]HAV7717209.1 ead/Ea22-like family protein [Escherichia coli]HAV9553302.1 ead/Ea22-like family protein [Escherichia coli]HAW5409157.1 ead/Ea22-like family protein [Escherichia coli]HAW6368651.1 ead/Ea22-like family protein [Escherichia coli]
MSEINYQELREVAEKATWGDWDSYKPHRGARGYEVRLSSQAIAQHVLKNNAEFIAAFNPKIALALLDERERNLQYIKRRDQENEDIALTVGRLRVELEAAKKRIAELEAREIKPAKGEVLVVVSGFTGCGKSAIAGEIEIAMKAIGVPVQWTNGDAEKRMTGADWLTAIEMYKPTVRIVEVNVPRAPGIRIKGE